MGHWENLRVNEKGELMADLVIEADGPDEKRYIQKIENGDIKGASIGADIITWTEESVHLKPGQTRPTLLECELFEISLAPLPANKNALALQRNGTLVNLGAGSDAAHFLPTIKKSDTDMKAIALKLGLPETATETEILAALGKVQMRALQAESAGALLDKALGTYSAGLSEKDKGIFDALAKTDPDKAVAFAAGCTKEGAETTGSEQPAQKPSTIASLLKRGSGDKKDGDAEKDCYDYLQKHNKEELARIHKEEPDKYAILAAEYAAGKRYEKK